MPEISPSAANELQAEFNRNFGRGMDDIRVDLKELRGLVAGVRDQVTTINASDALGRINNLSARLDRIEADYRITAKDFEALKNKLIPLGTLGLIVLGALITFGGKLIGH